MAPPRLQGQGPAAVVLSIWVSTRPGAIASRFSWVSRCRSVLPPVGAAAADGRTRSRARAASGRWAGTWRGFSSGEGQRMIRTVGRPAAVPKATPAGRGRRAGVGTRSRPRIGPVRPRKARPCGLSGARAGEPDLPASGAFPDTAPGDGPTVLGRRLYFTIYRPLSATT